jgi:hypothetical protein
VGVQNNVDGFMPNNSESHTPREDFQDEEVERTLELIFSHCQSRLFVSEGKHRVNVSGAARGNQTCGGTWAARKEMAQSKCPELCGRWQRTEFDPPSPRPGAHGR